MIKTNKTVSYAIGLGACLAGYGLSRLAKPKSEDLRSQVALITGGSKGLGLALAEQLLDRGCHLALSARSEEELRRAEEHLAQRPSTNTRGTVATFVCDSTDPEAIEKLHAGVIQRFDQIDILINNAGLIEVAPVEALRLEDFERAMNLMFYGHLRLTLAVLPKMMERQAGHIVNVSSIGGVVSVPHLLPYCSAKFALTGLSEGLSVELKKKNVHVLTVIPGLMRTGSHVNAEFKGDVSKEYRWFALGATMPGIAQDARIAAERIISALRMGKDQCITSMPAQILSLMHGTAPATTRQILAIADRYVLPGPSKSQKRVAGRTEDRMKGPVFRGATALGRSAGSELNQNG